MFKCRIHLDGQNDLLKCFLASLKAFKDKLVMYHAVSKHLKQIPRVKLVRIYTITVYVFLC